MPIKEFECQACKKKFDAILGIKEPNPAACPSCGGKELKQLLSTFKIGGGTKKSKGDEEFGGGSPDLAGMGGMEGMDGPGGFGGDDGGMMDGGGGLEDAGGMGDDGGLGDDATGGESAADE